MSVRCLRAMQRFRFVSGLRRACDHRCRFPLHTSAPIAPVRRGTGCTGGGASDTDRPSGALVARFQTAGREPSLLCAPRAPSQDLRDEDTGAIVRGEYIFHGVPGIVEHCLVRIERVALRVQDDNGMRYSIGNPAKVTLLLKEFVICSFSIFDVSI